MLSRHPVETRPESEPVEDHEIDLIISEGVPVDSRAISIETRRDPGLSRVVQWARQGWPEKLPSTREDLRPYFIRKNEITVEQDCLLWGYRVIIPTKLRRYLLEELHASHLGIVKMKSIARSYFWWPKLDQQIETIAKSCKPCLMTSDDPPKSLTTPWYRPKGPNERVHIDFLGPVDDTQYLITQDAFSKWTEVFKMRKITSEATIKKMREYFTRWGIPEKMVSDNGKQLVSEEFESFLRKNGVRHATGPPYHPQTNGQAESAVKSFKKGLKAALKDERNRKTTKDILICRYLLHYNNSKHCTTNETPAKLMIGRDLRTAFDLVKPNIASTIEDNQNRRQKQRGRCYEQIEEGSKVLTRDYRDTNKKGWLEAKVIKADGYKNYTCELEDGRTVRRHIEQIKRLKSPERLPNKSNQQEEKHEQSDKPHRRTQKVPGRKVDRTESSVDTDTRLDQPLGNTTPPQEGTARPIPKSDARPDSSQLTRQEGKFQDKPKRNIATKPKIVPQTKENPKPNPPTSPMNTNIRAKRDIKKPSRFDNFVS